MQPEDRASERAKRRMTGEYLENRRKRRERKIAQRMGLIPSRRTDPPKLTLLTRDDLDNL